MSAVKPILTGRNWPEDACLCSGPATCRYGLPDGSCALARAADGPITLDEIGAVLGLCRERVRTLERQALSTFARRALSAEVIDRLPRWGERTVHEREREPDPERDDGQERDEDELRVERASVLDFGPGTDDAACEAVWTMLQKRRAAAGPQDSPTASLSAVSAEAPADENTLPMIHTGGARARGRAALRGVHDARAHGTENDDEHDEEE